MSIAVSEVAQRIAEEVDIETSGVGEERRNGRNEKNKRISDTLQRGFEGWARVSNAELGWVLHILLSAVPTLDTEGRLYAAWLGDSSRVFVGITRWTEDERDMVRAALDQFLTDLKKEESSSFYTQYAYALRRVFEDLRIYL